MDVLVCNKPIISYLILIPPIQIHQTPATTMIDISIAIHLYDIFPTPCHFRVVYYTFISIVRMLGYIFNLRAYRNDERAL